MFLVRYHGHGQALNEGQEAELVLIFSVPARLLAGPLPFNAIAELSFELWSAAAIDARGVYRMHLGVEHSIDGLDILMPEHAGLNGARAELAKSAHAPEVANGPGGSMVC